MAQEVEVKIKVSTDQAVNDVNKLGDAFDSSAKDAKQAEEAFNKAGNGIKVEDSMAGLKQLKRELKNVAVGSDEFKQIYNQIDDLEDKLKSAKNVSSDWVDSLEQSSGPLGMLGAGINKAKVATQSFGGALKATGIGLIVALIGGLVAAFSENESAMKKIQPLIDGLKKAFQGVFRAVEPLFNTFVDLATDALPYVTKGIGMVYSAMMAYFTFIKESGGGVMKILKGVFTLDADSISAGIDQVGGSFKKTQASYTDSMKRFSEGSKELTQSEKDELEKREENRKKALEKQAENERKAKEKADELAKKKAEEKKKYDEDVLKGQEELNRIKSEKDLEDSINKRSLLDNQIALLNEGVDAVQQAETKTTEIIKTNSKSRIALTEAEKKAKLEAADAIANTLSGMSDLLGKETAAGKAAAVASATINTFSSAQKAYDATVGIPYVGPVLAPINAGIAIAAGIKNVKSILAVKVPGGGGGSAPTISAPPPAAPQFNVVGQSGANQIASAIGGTEAKPIKAYVVSNDVTTGQALNRSIISNASIG